MKRIAAPTVGSFLIVNDYSMISSFKNASSKMATLISRGEKGDKIG
jgi:hypothetical protein